MRHEEQDSTSGPRWWATLDDDALEDETRSNRRRERWLPVLAVLALLATCVVLFAHTESLFS